MTDPHTGLSRRALLSRAGRAGLAISSLPVALAACGGVRGSAEEHEPAQDPSKVRHPQTEIAAWTFSNWPLYMDRKLLRQFDEQTGGKVRYLEDVNDSYEFFGKVRQQLENGKPIGRDLVVLTDFMVARWVRNGYCEPIDKQNVPNARNLVENLRSINYDPERAYSLPFQSGAIGIGYDIEKTGRELTSVKDLFDAEFKGRVTMLAEPYDSACTVLIGDGVDPSEASIDEILGAIERIASANEAGQFRRFTGNDYTADLAKGNVWVSLAYSGDLVQLQSDNPNLRFSYFDEGNVAFNDNLIIPAHAEHPYAAEAMMNFLYEPEVAAKLAAFVNYISPVNGAKDILAKTDPELAENPLLFPPPEVQAKLKAYPALSPADERAMQEAMAVVTGA